MLTTTQIRGLNSTAINVLGSTDINAFTGATNVQALTVTEIGNLSTTNLQD